ncbi:MAG TPA: methyltransferase domain-containing protein [Thermoleophilaceae bacterium]
MVTPDLHAFVRANLPAPPARVLEVGAGDGELARALVGTGYDVLAIDPEPGGPDVRASALHELEEPPGSFAAAVAVVSLHHVDPLAESLGRLATVLVHGAPVVIDEFDVGTFDTRAAQWWLDERRTLGGDEQPTAEELVEEHRHHLHSLDRILDALGAHFDFGTTVRGAYLYRWNLGERLRLQEEELIAQGRIPAVGARLVARRRQDSRKRPRPTRVG